MLEKEEVSVYLVYHIYITAQSDIFFIFSEMKM